MGGVSWCCRVCGVDRGGGMGGVDWDERLSSIISYRY